MPNNDSHHHVVKTTEQWQDRAVEYWVVPRGTLCVELTPEKKTKIKIGEGSKYYSQLPYICDGHDMSNYYTKEETDRLLDNLNRMAIQSTDVYDTKDDLPLAGNRLGDVRFVRSTSEQKVDPDVYLWNGSKWIYVGYDFANIDLDRYLTKTEFHSEFDPVRDKVDEMYPKMHTHDNKDVLDRTERPFTIADKEKLDSLENYDDTEIRELIRETGHVHWNKHILDTITEDKLWTVQDREKFESLHNYDDTELRNRMGVVESKAHAHTNKDILDQTTAPFKTEDKQKLDSLENYDIFIGTDGRYPGVKGLVPAPSTLDIGTFLSSDGTWKKAGFDSDFVGATPYMDGEHGLVPAPLMGEQSYFLRGDGTWAKIKQGGDKYKAGEGIYILSGEVATDTFPFQVYSRSGHLEQYIIYGNTGGVGDAMTGGVYGVNITITDEHGNSSNTSVILPEKISLGDYIDYAKQVFVHMRTDVSSLISVDPSYNWRWAIRPDGSIQYTDIGAYGRSPQVTSLIELEPGITYELYHACTYPAFSNYMNLNVYDTEQNRTRTINFYDSTGKVPTIIALGPNEKYIRLTWEHADRYPNTLIRVKAVETTITLPQIPLFPNSINTINVTNTIKPAEIYVEVAEPSEDDPDDPMSDFTGIIYNDGVLDVTQEDPNALNELTFHYRDNVDKTLTIPETPLEPATTTTLGGIIVGDNLVIDENGVLSATGGGSGGENYEAGEAIRFTKHTPEILPAAYQLVDYIQSTGEQGIELNYIPASSYIKYEFTFSDIVFANTDFHYLIGGYAGDAVGMRAPSIDYNFSNWPNKVAVPCGRNDPITNGEVPSDMTIPHTYTLTVSNGSVSLQLDDGVVRTGSYSGNISQKVGLFCSPSYTAGDPSAIFQTSAYKFHELKIYEGNSSSNLTLIHHYYPCYRISDDVPGIYDVVTDTFLTNVGTGDLIIGTITGTPVINVQHGDGLEVDANNDLNVKLGNGLRFDANEAIEAIPYVAGTGIDIESYAPARLPVEYQEVEYIASDGVTQNYINTGIHQPMTVVIDMKYNTNATQQYMGWSVTGKNRYFGVDTYSKYNLEDTPGSVTGIDLDVTERRTITVSFRTDQASTMTIEGQTITNFTTEGSDIYTTNDFLLFTLDKTDYFSNATIYEVTIYDTNFQPIFHGIPCYRVSDNVSGLYDLVTETFKPSIGGNLAVGPDVLPNNSYKIINTGLLSVEQDQLDPNHLTFETIDGDIDVTIPGSNYVEGDAISIEHPQISSTITHVKWVLLNTRNRSSAGDIVQVGEFELYDMDDQLLTYSSISATFGNGGTPTYGTNQYQQTPDKLIDGDANLKMCCTNFTTSCLGLEITMELMDSIDIRDIKQYRYITANDMDVRDPVTWDLYVSSDGTDWTLVDRQVDDSTIPTARETSTAYYEITHPTSDDLAIGVKYGNGLRLDANGALEVVPGGGLIPGRGLEFSYPILETYRVLDKIRKPSGTTLTTDVMPSGTVDFFCDLKYYKYTGNSFLILCYDGERGSFCYTPAPTASGSWARMWIYTAHENWYDLYLDGSFASTSPIVAHLRWGNRMSMSFDHTSTTAQNTPGVLPGQNLFKFDSSSDADLYWAKFYENSSLVGELVPVIRQSDSAVGMFNKVTETFSTVSGLIAGTLTGEVINIYDETTTPNTIDAKLGVGLTFDSDDAVTLDESTDLVFNCDYSE